MNLGERLNEAMKLWFDLTGHDPEARRMTFGDWDIRRMSEAVMEGFDLDDSLVTSYFLLAAFADDYFDQRTVSIKEMDEDPDRVLAYMTKVRDFKKLINAPEIVAIGVEFQQQIAGALAHYGVPYEQVSKVVEDRHLLGFLRRDALRSFERLRINQFLAGESEPDGITPLYNPTVFSYWNMNSCIEHLCAMPSGVSLNLIRDPDELHSYFCFTVRNGGNLITLSDVPEYAHPMGRHMSRRPDRAFDQRVSKNWFPYQLLSIAYDDKGNAYHDKYRETLETGLVPHNVQHFKLKDIKELEPAQIIWTILVFDLINERYWRQQPEPLPLSYTAEMLRIEEQDRLLGAAARSNLLVIGYQPLSLPALTSADVRTETLDEAAVGKRSARWEEQGRYGFNKWMEDRYGDRVVDEVLNLVSGPDQKVRFITDGSELKPNSFGHGKSLVVHGEVQSMDAGDFKSFSFFARDLSIYRMQAVDGTTFGTREQIDADRKFLARLNFAKAVQREADQEFKARHAEIVAWFEDRVKGNLDVILPYCIPDRLTHETIYRTWAGVGAKSVEEDSRRVKYTFAGTDLIKPPKGEDYLDGFARGSFGHTVGLYQKSGTGRFAEWDCFLTGARPTWVTLLKPRTIDDFLLLTGLSSREELPDILQNWHPKDEKPYVGNSILDRIDPLLWALHNPWSEERFKVRIYLSKRGRNRIAKDYDPPVSRASEETPYAPLVIRS